MQSTDNEPTAKTAHLSKIAILGARRRRNIRFVGDILGESDTRWPGSCGQDADYSNAIEGDASLWLSDNKLKEISLNVGESALTIEGKGASLSKKEIREIGLNILQKHSPELIEANDRHNELNAYRKEISNTEGGFERNVFKSRGEFFGRVAQCEEQRLLLSLANQLIFCSKVNLMQDDADSITSMACGSKFCNVCNYRRADDLRRRWIGYLQKPHLFGWIECGRGQWAELHPAKAGCKGSWTVAPYMADKAYTHHYTEKLCKSWRIYNGTLTIRRDKQECFAGKRWYLNELHNCWKELNRQKWFKMSIIGGVNNYEIKVNEHFANHIHMHLLLFVNESEESLDILRDGIGRMGGKWEPSWDVKNLLEQAIAIYWSNHTKNVFDKTDEEKKKINAMKAMYLREKKRNYTGIDFAGSSKIDIKPIRYHDGREITGNFADGNKLDSSIVAAVMECLKYHIAGEDTAHGEARDKRILTTGTGWLVYALPYLHRAKLCERSGALAKIKELRLSGDDKEEREPGEPLPGETGEILGWELGDIAKIYPEKDGKTVNYGSAERLTDTKTDAVAKYSAKVKETIKESTKRQKRPANAEKK